MIPYGRHYIDEDDIQAVVEVLRGGVLTQGPTVEAFIDHIDTVRESVRMSAADFAGGDRRVHSGLIALASTGRFCVTQFARDEDLAAVLKRIEAGPSDEVLIYRLPEKRA